MTQVGNIRARIGIPTATSHTFLFVGPECEQWDPWWSRLHEFLLEQSLGLTTWTYDPERSLFVGDVALSEVQKSALMRFLRTAPDREIAEHKTLRRAVGLPEAAAVLANLMLFRTE